MNNECPADLDEREWLEWRLAKIAAIQEGRPEPERPQPKRAAQETPDAPPRDEWIEAFIAAELARLRLKRPPAMSPAEIIALLIYGDLTQHAERIDAEIQAA
jgi:hypothetical protein